MKKVSTHSTSLSLCRCGWKLQKRHTIQAVVYDLTGKEHVLIDTKQCRNCSMEYGPNFRRRSGDLLNTVVVSSMGLEQVLFINSKVGFTIRYLKYHAHLLVRCAASARGLEWCYEKTFFDGCGDKMGWEGNFRKLHYDALVYYMVAIEWEKIGKHTSLAIGNELNEETLNQYDHFCHENLFPPSRRNKVTAIVCDGHQKVLDS